jgi:hypothetical protein
MGRIFSTEITEIFSARPEPGLKNAHLYQWHVVVGPSDESRTCARSSSPLRGCELRLPALLGAPPLQLPICDHPDPPPDAAQSSVDWRSPSAAAHFSPVAAANRSSPEVAAHRSTYIVAWADLTQAVGAGPWHCSKSSSSCGCGEREDVRRVEKSVRERRSGGES